MSNDNVSKNITDAQRTVILRAKFMLWNFSIDNVITRSEFFAAGSPWEIIKCDA